MSSPDRYAYKRLDDNGFIIVNKKMSPAGWAREELFDRISQISFRRSFDEIDAQLRPHEREEFTGEAAYKLYEYKPFPKTKSNPTGQHYMPNRGWETVSEIPVGTLMPYAKKTYSKQLSFARMYAAGKLLRDAPRPNTRRLVSEVKSASKVFEDTDWSYSYDDMSKDETMAENVPYRSDTISERVYHLTWTKNDIGTKANCVVTHRVMRKAMAINLKSGNFSYTEFTRLDEDTDKVYGWYEGRASDITQYESSEALFFKPGVATPLLGLVEAPDNASDNEPDS